MNFKEHILRAEAERQFLAGLRSKRGLRLDAQETTAIAPSMSDLKQRKKRWDDAYESGSLDIQTYRERVASLEAEIQSLKESQRAPEEARQVLTTLAEAIDGLPRYFREAEPERVNALLRRVLERIEVGDGVELVWRG